MDSLGDVGKYSKKFRRKKKKKKIAHLNRSRHSRVKTHKGKLTHFIKAPEIQWILTKNDLYGRMRGSEAEVHLKRRWGGLRLVKFKALQKQKWTKMSLIYWFLYEVHTNGPHHLSAKAGPEFQQKNFYSALLIFFLQKKFQMLIT